MATVETRMKLIGKVKDLLGEEEWLKVNRSNHPCLPTFAERITWVADAKTEGERLNYVHYAKMYMRSYLGTDKYNQIAEQLDTLLKPERAVEDQELYEACQRLLNEQSLSKDGDSQFARDIRMVATTALRYLDHDC